MTIVTNLEEYIIKLLKENPNGLETNDINKLISTKLGANLSYNEIQNILELLQADLKVIELFDDEVELKNKWYLKK